MPLERRQLPHGNREPPNRESEHHDRRPGPHPREKCPLIRQMIARPIRICTCIPVHKLSRDSCHSEQALFAQRGIWASRARRRAAFIEKSRDATIARWARFLIKLMHSPMPPALFHSFPDHNPRTCKILDQLLRHAMPLLQIRRIVVGHRHLARGILGHQCL